MVKTLYFQILHKSSLRNGPVCWTLFAKRFYRCGMRDEAGECGGGRRWETFAVEVVVVVVVVVVVRCQCCC